MARAVRRQTVVGELSEVFEDVVERAESVAERGFDAALSVLPGPAEDLVRDLTKQTRKTVKTLDKRRTQAVKRVEKRIADLDKRRQRITKRAEKRIDGIVDAVEQGVSGVVRPVAKRLDLASQSEVASLKRRLSQLERKLGSAKRTRKTASKRKKTTRRRAA